MRVIQPGLESLAQLLWSYLPSIFFFLCNEDHLNSLQGLAPTQSIEVFLIFHVQAENHGIAPFLKMYMDNKCDLFLQDIESQSIEGRKKCREILSMSPFTHLLMFTVISIPSFYSSL